MNRRPGRTVRTRVYATLAVVTCSATASAQLTWDPVGGVGIGTWDAVTANWDDGSAPPLTVWDNTGAQTAIFGDYGGDAFVEVADGGVTVGDLTVQAGTGKIQLASITDNLGLITIKAGGAAWNTGGREIEFLNNQANDTPLSISTGDTLTVSGGGEFDTGEKPNGANWSATGATLDVVDPTVVRGSAQTIAQFDTVGLAAGSIYVHERNTNQDYNNDWNVTGTGNVTFANRFTRISWLNGVFSGSAGLTFQNGGGASNGYFRLNNAGNSFSGGVVVDATGNATQLWVTVDAALGAVPGAFDADNITLRNGGILKTQFSNLEANRGILLDGGGTLLPATNHLNAYGAISGTGGLQVGTVGEVSDKYVIMNVPNSYEGGTDVAGGNLLISDDNQLGAVPVAFDAANVTLRNDSFLKFQFGATTLDANRGITLDEGGTIIAGTTGGSTHVINGPITGTGSLNIGYGPDGANGTVVLNAPATYTGDTNVRRGYLVIGVDDAIPTDGLLTIGGNGTSVFDLGGFDQTVAGLAIAGGNTRSLSNDSVTPSTLTIDVPDTESYSYSANVIGTGVVNFVKTGLGLQSMVRPSNYTTDPGDVTVNEGILEWDVKDTYGAVTVNDGGTLVLSQTGSPASFTAAVGSQTSFIWAIGDWTGVEGTDWPLLTVAGDFSILAAQPSFDIVIDDDSITNFAEGNQSFTIATVGGTLNAVDADFSVDASGFTAGSGSWSARVDGSNLVLDYVSGDPYAGWATTNITDIDPLAPAGFDDDADGDGVDNGLEWILGGDPLVADGSTLVGSSIDATNVTFTFSREDDSVGVATLDFQWSLDLATWNDVPVTSGDTTDGDGVNVNVVDGVGTDSVTVTVPRSLATDGKLFGRLNATQL